MSNLLYFFIEDKSVFKPFSLHLLIDFVIINFLLFPEHGLQSNAILTSQQLSITF